MPGPKDRGLKADIAKIEMQERELRFTRFAEAEAWALGAQMRDAASKRKLPIVIDIRIGERQMFFACLPGTSADNSDWVRRKANTVQRFHKSSYLVGRQYDLRGAEFGPARGIEIFDYAKDGGGFPIHIEGTGVVGVITVSGVPQRDDHGFVVEQVALFQGKKPAVLALGPER